MKLQAEAWNFIKNVTLAQVFSRQFCEISKNIFLTEHLQWLLLFHGIDFFTQQTVRFLLSFVYQVDPYFVS